MDFAIFFITESLVLYKLVSIAYYHIIVEFEFLEFLVQESILLLIKFGFFFSSILISFIKFYVMILLPKLFYLIILSRLKVFLLIIRRENLLS